LQKGSGSKKVLYARFFSPFSSGGSGSDDGLSEQDSGWRSGSVPAWIEASGSVLLLPFLFFPFLSFLERVSGKKWKIVRGTRRSKPEVEQSVLFFFFFFFFLPGASVEKESKCKRG